MSQTDRDQKLVEEPFALTLDDYGRVWLHAKLEGIEVAIDLADKDPAFSIMAEKMAECDFEYRPSRGHEEADNDDQIRS